MRIFEYLKYQYARIFFIVRTSFFSLGLYVKKAEDDKSGNSGYAIALTCSLLWFQVSWEITLWDDWRI
jgi:hypothetical protein